MFLFSTPPVREAQPATPVVEAIRTGAERTGTEFDYLLATARRESALDPAARAKTSSAAGLFQFVEQTWLGVLKADGAKHGLGDYAAAISTRPDGTLAVNDPAMRRTIMALREDPQTASVLPGALTQRNRDMLAADLGREPSGSDLYLAHFLGARGATDLIRTAQTAPQRAAALDFPDAAAANRGIFYDRSGRARGAGEVYALLSASHGAGEATAAPAFAPNRPLAPARQEGPALHRLFQTTGRGGPMSDAVARLWATNTGDPARAAALGGFFPRTQRPDSVSPAEDDLPAQAPAGPVAAPAPLPPPRPAHLSASAIGAPRPALSEGSIGRRRAAPPPVGGPLDLTAFTRGRRT